MHFDHKAYGERIKRLRTGRDLTQEQLAEKINVSRTYIVKIENGLQIVMHQLCIDDGNIQPCVVEQFCNRCMVISCGLHDHASLTVQAFELLCQLAQFTAGVTDFKG